MIIRKATPKDEDAIREILSEVIAGGDTYVFDSYTSKSDLKKLWLGENMHAYATEDQGLILGTYVIKPNQMGRGSHIANGSYMVSSKYRGKGIGKLMCEHSLEEAGKAGFHAMWFNIVVSTNTVALALWEKMGFEIIGTIPDGFNHKSLGLVDAFIMNKKL